MRSFKAIFGHLPQVQAEAPGRVNLIGEHTDYNGGYVLPAAIAQTTRVELAPRGDRRVRLWSAQFAGDAVEYELGGERRGGRWADYAMGMTRVLAPMGRLGGFDARIESTVPVGSGLSSSAALEIALGRGLRALFGLEIGDVELARAAQRAENEFVGAPVGIMDQMACSLADQATALFLDTRTLEHSRIPIPPTAALIVIDSGVSHSHAGGDYATRRRECAEAARLLGVAELRDVSVEDMRRIEALPAPLNRRARHVVTENARVLETVEALKASDLDRVGRLFAASHASMRDDFAVSVSAVDALVRAAMHVGGVYGARLTGGGFGGAIVAIAARGQEPEAAAEIVRGHQHAGYSDARVLLPVPSL
jgi:galactokinase